MSGGSLAFPFFRTLFSFKLKVRISYSRLFNVYRRPLTNRRQLPEFGSLFFFSKKKKKKKCFNFSWFGEWYNFN
jgi:hypothetical protein